MNLKTRIWEDCRIARPGDKASRVFDIGILSLIFLNVVAVIIGSVQSLQERWGSFLNVFEIVSVVVFTVQYVARLWSCTADPQFNRPMRGRLRHVFRMMSIIDLLAILPFYLPFLGIDLRSLRVLRLLRILRIAKAGRYYSSPISSSVCFETRGTCSHDSPPGSSTGCLIERALLLPNTHSRTLSRVSQQQCGGRLLALHDSWVW